MKHPYFRFLHVLSLVPCVFFLACSEVDLVYDHCHNFSTSKLRAENLKLTSDGTDQSCNFDYQVQNKIPQISLDILFVNDNSGTMKEDQEDQEDKEQFRPFFEKISSLKQASEDDGFNLDVELFMITTDKRYDVDRMKDSDDFENFLTILIRQDTKECWKGLQEQDKSPQERDCENGMNYERGIYNAKDFVESSHELRAEAQMDIIFFSDEDDKVGSRVDEFQEAMKWRFGEEKDYATHSIIIEPNDTGCKQIQEKQRDNVPGLEFCRNNLRDPRCPSFATYGTNYARLSSSTGGTIQSICASQYAPTITSNMETRIEDKKTQLKKDAMRSLHLACSSPEELILTIHHPNKSFFVDCALDDEGRLRKRGTQDKRKNLRENCVVKKSRSIQGDQDFTYIKTGSRIQVESGFFPFGSSYDLQYTCK